MKFILKLAIVIALAKFIAGMPVGTHPYVDAFAQFSIRDLAVHIDTTVTQIQTFLTARL